MRNTLFDLRLYLKNNILLQEELPKNKWVDLNKKETAEYASDIFDLINNAYLPIGGNLNYKNVSDVLGAEGDANYEIINIDNDPEPDAVNVYKKQPAGNKLTAIGHDGSKDAKSKAINHKSDLLKQPGYYIEVSGKMKDILLSKGVPVVTDPGLIRKVLKGKNIEMNDDGTYQRVIGGETHTKTLIGNPL
jgi:hypothetical protein